METNPNIIRLVEMLEHPEVYTEQEIHDIINPNDETRAAYRLMVAAKQGYHRKHTESSADIDAVWHRFESKKLSATQSHASFRKIAATFIGILLLSGVTIAAIQLVRWQQKDVQKMKQPTEEVASQTKGALFAVADDTVSAQHVVFDNIPLEKMLTEIAGYYDAAITFQNDTVRQLRFHFVWDRRRGLDKVVSDLNHFKRLHVALKDNQLIVE